jgi:hypothetical protein
MLVVIIIINNRVIRILCRELNLFGTIDITLYI